MKNEKKKNIMMQIKHPTLFGGLQDLQARLCADRNFYEGFPNGIFWDLVVELNKSIEVFDKLILEEKNKL